MSNSSVFVAFETVSNGWERAIRFSAFITLVGIVFIKTQVEFLVIDICARSLIQLKRKCTDPGQCAIIDHWDLSLLGVTSKYVEGAFPCDRAAIVDLCTRAIFKAEISSTTFDRSSQVGYVWNFNLCFSCVQNQDWGQICCNWVSVFNLVSTGIIFRKQF